MSIQYELVLALSEPYNLKKMLNNFLRTCNSRLNLSSSHIFLYHDKNGNPTEERKNCGIKHITSIPKRNKEKEYKYDDKLLQAVIAYNNSENENENENEKKYYFFKIENYGVMATSFLERDDFDIAKTLAPIIEKLQLSCKSAIDHGNIIREVEARKAAEEKIAFQANHDYLTRLYNIRYFNKKLEKALKNSESENSSGSVIFINVNNLKQINELMGHGVGDKTIEKIANRIKKITPIDFPIARLGGNEFVILIESSNKDNIEPITKNHIERILTYIKKPMSINNNNYALSAYIGYDIFHNGNKSSDELIKNSNLAMHEAKRSDLSSGLKYNDKMSEKLNQKILYEVEIKQAIKNDEFELHYQPQFDIYGNIIGTEALLRWNNPNRGYESPAVYIPIAEQSDLIIKISEWVLNQACKDIYRLEQLSLPESFKKTSINISAKHISQDNFVETILTAIKKHNIDPQHFSIEITESIMMGDIKSSIKILETLKDTGIQFSIDDFGTGYSSLSYLKQLPADVIKIDRAFVKDINVDKNNYAIAKMIIGLGKNLNMDIIAEGVETQEELDCLKKLGCHQYQGYFFCKPIPFDQLTQLLCKK